jgi:hypothetical protein
MFPFGVPVTVAAASTLQCPAGWVAGRRIKRKNGRGTNVPADAGCIPGEETVVRARQCRPVTRNPNGADCLLLPFSITSKRGSAQTFLLAEGRAAQPAAFVFGHQFFNFRPTPATFTLYSLRLLVHTSSSPLAPVHEQVCCSNAYDAFRFYQSSSC